MERHRPPRLSLDLLRGFRAAARHLSFTRAARELHVTQPAISREIKALETQLGHALFLRANRSLTLTQAGEQLYRATDDALALIDAAAERIAGGGGALSVTTTTALASLWLVPRLSRFTRRHPDVDVRIAASNDTVDIERGHFDLAIRYVPPWADTPDGELLVPYRQFPVCAPSLLRGRARSLRTPGDLARYVRLDFETILYGRSWYDWTQWFDGLGIRPVDASGTLRFSHYDQVIQAAIGGSGVAIGKWPHLAQHLRDGAVVAPLGRTWVASLGGFHLVIARRAADRAAVAAFVAWLKEETRRDEERAPRAIGLVAESARRGGS